MERIDSGWVKWLAVGRIKDDGVEVTYTTLGKEGSDITLDSFDETIIFLRSSANGFHTGLGGVDCHDMLGACTSCLKGEGTAMGVAIQYSAAFAETTNECVLLALIKKKARLLCFQEVDMVGKSVDLDPAGLKILAALGSRCIVLVDDDLLRFAGFFQTYNDFVHVSIY